MSIRKELVQLVAGWTLDDSDEQIQQHIAQVSRSFDPLNEVEEQYVGCAVRAQNHVRKLKEHAGVA